MLVIRSEFWGLGLPKSLCYIGLGVSPCGILATRTHLLQAFQTCPLYALYRKPSPSALRKENAPSYFICIFLTWGREEGTSFILEGRHYLAVSQCHVLEPLRTCHNSSITPHIHRLSRRTVTLQHDHIILARWHNTPYKVLKYSPPNKYERTPS